MVSEIMVDQDDAPEVREMRELESVTSHVIEYANRGNARPALTEKDVRIQSRRDRIADRRAQEETVKNADRDAETIAEFYRYKERMALEYVQTQLRPAQGHPQRTAAAEKQLKADSQQLLRDYRRLSQQLDAQRNKFRLNQRADDEKYRDLWEMNKEEVLDLLQDVLTADKVDYLPGSGDQNQGEDGAAREILVKMIHQGSTSNIQLADSSWPTCTIAPSTMIKMLTILGSEASFLIEEKLQRLLKSVDDNEAILVKLDAIFKALKLESDKDIQALMSQFLRRHQSSGNVIEPHEILEPYEFLPIMRQFVSERDQRTHDTIRKTHRKDTEQVKVNLTNEREFWGRLENVVSRKTERVWDSLLNGLDRYNTELKDRDQLNTGIQDLEHYMHSQTTQDLVIPPL
eukprot:Clim_evm45s152 gene=Clim_evmTU45s152